MGMAVAPVLVQDAFRFRTHDGDLSYGLAGSATALANENVNPTISKDPFRIGLRVAQTADALSPAVSFVYYPFYSVNGGAYNPVVRFGNSTLANQSPIVGLDRVTTAASTTTGLTSYISSTTGSIRNQNGGVGSTVEVSSSGARTYAEASNAVSDIFDMYFRLQYNGSIAQNDIIRVRAYYSTTGTVYTTVSALQSAITSGDVIPLGGGYTQTPEITVPDLTVVGDLAVSEAPLADTLSATAAVLATANMAAAEVGSDGVYITHLPPPAALAGAISSVPIGSLPVASAEPTEAPAPQVDFLFVQEEGEDTLTASGELGLLAIPGTMAAQEQGQDTSSVSGVVVPPLFDLQLFNDADDPEIDPPLQSVQDISGTTYNITNLSPATDYKWRVLAVFNRIAERKSDWTIPTSFQTLPEWSLQTQESGDDVLSATFTVDIAAALAAQGEGEDVFAASGAVAVQASLQAQGQGQDAFSGTMQEVTIEVPTNLRIANIARTSARFEWDEPL